MALVLTAASLPPLAPAQEGGGSCSVCHRRLDDGALSRPAVEYERDVHAGTGLTCTGCHGGDAVAADERIAHAGMVARPDRARIPAMCGRCHSNPELMKRFDPDIRIDQVEAYWTSHHGELLREGDTRVATCTDCHTYHSIQPPSEEQSSVHPASIPELCGACHADPEYMAPYPIGTDQLEEYRRSVHWAAVEGGDLSAAVCNDCHGNHGAVPPGYASVGRVCAECHAQIGQYFAISPHDSAFAAIGRPGCATCHGNHDIEPADDELLGLGEAATCRGSGCHSESDEGGRAASTMLALIDSLRTVQERADSILEAAELAGMPVSEAQFELTQVRNALVSARAVMHSARLDSVRAKIDEGLAAARGGYDDGVAAFDELRVRRTGLAVSAAVVLVLIVGLVIRIRQLGHAA